MTASGSPYRNVCRFRVSPFSRLMIAIPRATTVEKKTPMTVSDESPVRPLTRVMATATMAPNATIVQEGETPRRTPRATPVKAEWPIASEKKAIRCWTSGTPSAAAAGAVRSSARSARFMNAGSAKANGSSRSIRANTPERIVSTDPYLPPSSCRCP